MATPAGEPSNATVMAILERLEKAFGDQAEATREEIRLLRAEMGTGFVRTDVWRQELESADRERIEIRAQVGRAFKAIEGANARITTAYKIAVVSLLVPILAAVVYGIVSGSGR